MGSGPWYEPSLQAGQKSNRSLTTPLMPYVGGQNPRTEIVAARGGTERTARFGSRHEHYRRAPRIGTSSGVFHCCACLSGGTMGVTPTTPVRIRPYVAVAVQL
jgi:hypothetical protein